MVPSLGMQKRNLGSPWKSLSDVVARCSYAIYLSRKNKDWDKKRELLAEADVPQSDFGPGGGEHLLL